MPDYLNKNGETYTEEELIGYAEEEGLTLEEYMNTKTFEVVEPGKTSSSTEDPTTSDMDLGSDDGLLEQPEELSSFDKWSAKVRKYTPNFLLTEKEQGLKETEKLQEEKLEEERVSSDDYIKDAESFTRFIKDDFLVNEDYLKEKLGTDNLAAIDLKQDIGGLTKVVREDLGIAGMFGTDTRVQYPNLTNEDIDGIIRNQFYNKVKNQKLEIAERKKSNAIQSIIDGGGDVADEISSVVDLDIASFDNPIERQLGVVNKELRTEGLAPERKKELTDKQQELVAELNKPRKIIGRQGQIIEIKNEDKFKFFYNPVTGKSSGEKTEDSVDNTEKTQTYITEYSTAQEKLEDYYNDNVLQAIGHKKEGEKTYNIKVGNEAFSGILRNMGYKDEKGVYKNISVSDMARFAHLFDDKGMGSGKKFMAENQIEAVNTDDFTSPEDFADYLLVYQEQGRDIAAKKSALKEVYILNKDITSIKKKPIQRHFEAASESIIGPRATESNFGYSNRKILDNIEEITANAEIKLGDEQKEHLERSIGDEINEGFGGAYGILASLYGANKVQGAVLGITKLGRFMSTLAAPRYMKNGKVVSQSKLVKQAAKEGKNFDDLAAGYKKIGPSMMNKFNGLVLTGTMEEVKMQTVGFDPGVGAGFMLGAKALPFKFNTKYNQLNTALNTAFKGGPAFVLGTNFGELTKGAIEDIANEQEYSSFLEEHYGDLDKLGRKTIVDLSLGMLFGGTHLKSIDLKRTKDIAKLKNDAMSEMIKGYEQGNMNHVTKYQEIYSSAKNRLDAIDKIDLYSNPATAKKAYEKQLKPLVDAFKAKGKELQVEITSEELVDGRNAEYVRAQGSQPGKIRINTKKAKPGLVPHEAIHATFDLLFEGNATVKAKFLNSIKNVTKNLKLESGESLYDAILREKSIKDVEKVEEMFAYTTEFLSRAENYTQFVSSNAFSNIRNTIEGFAERQGISKPELKTQQQLVNFLGRYVETIQKGYNPVKQLERFKEIIDVSEASVKNQKQKSVGTRDLNVEIKELKKNKPEGYEKQITELEGLIQKSKLNVQFTNKYKELVTLEKERGTTEQLRLLKGRQLDKLRENNKGILTEYVEGNKSKGKTGFYKEVPGSSLTKAEFKEYVENIEFLKILDTYTKRGENLKDVPFNFYLEQTLRGGRGFGGGRLGNILKGLGIDMDKVSRTVSRDAEGFTETELAEGGGSRKETPSESAGIELIYKLPVEQKTIDNIRKKVEELDLESLDYLTLKDQASEATKKMFGKSTKDKAQFIVDNWKTLYDLLPKNLTETTGTATGIENSLMTRKMPDGTMKNVFYKGEGKTVKMKDTGAKTGTELQPKIKMGKEAFLKELGIVENLDGSIDISGMNIKVDRGITTSVLPALINQTGKAITNQIARGTTTNANLINRLGSGKSDALASTELLTRFNKKFPELSLERSQDIFINYALGDLKSIEKKHIKFIKNIDSQGILAKPEQAAMWSAVEIQGKKGKAAATKFEGEFNKYWNDFKGELPDGIKPSDVKKMNLKAFYSNYKGNVFVDAPRLNKHVDLSVEFAKMLPKDFKNSLTFFDQSIGLHQRVTMEKEGRFLKIDPKTGGLKGFIMDYKGETIINQPFVNGRERALPNLGKNTSKVWDNVGIKFKSASSQEAGQRKIAAAKTPAEQIKIADKYFSKLDNKTKENVYYALEATKQEFIEAGKTKKDKLDRMEWMYNVARSNTNLRMGARQTVPVKYVLFPEGPVTGEKIKLEHLKAMVTQSIQSANLIASGTFKKAGKDIVSDFIGITSTKKLLDIVDNLGGTTNTAGLYRMALLNPEILMQYKSVDSGFKRTLFDDVMLKAEKELFGPKKFKQIQKQNKLVEKRIDKQFEKIGLSLGSKNLSRGAKENTMKEIDKAIELGRKKNKESRGMSTFDFDETLVVGGKNFVTATKGKKSIKISSEKFPIDGPKLAEQGYKFDFKDFVNVKGGTEGPLMQKLRNQIKKYGNDNVFVLTARMQEAAPAIHAWLKSKNVDLPIKNITGLGNSTGEAKALWMLKKFSEGYNDMYFVDDALPNVKAVKNVLSQLDIKSKVQQTLGSKDLNKGVNKIMEHSLDIGSEKVFSKAEAKVRGKDIKRRRVFMRDSAADLELLIEPLYGKGKKGTENKKWFKKEFVMPFERGIRDYNTARQSAKNDYINLRRQNKDVVKEISKEVEGTTFTNDMAMRVYLWNKAGYKIPDLAKTTEAKLVEHVQNNPKLQAYAESFARITKQEKGLKEPGQNWWGETMAGEVTNINRGVSRKQYLQEWIDVKNEIFTEANLNKMESKLGTQWRENITDMFDRMETGRTRSLKLDRGSATMMNYLNGGIGTIMNFNTRSAVLQTISTANFLNMRENNPISAARAMGNTKQFVKDFKFIMNSDMLKQRRDGLAMNVTEAELASAATASKNPIQSIIAKVLKAGYLPTKMADSFAISFGGATFYRNRIKMYEKQGMKTKEAEKQAFLDFQVLAERTQQSSRADLLSKQQTSLIGRFILPFANTPMQMNRAGMKDILDISKGRFKGGRELTEKIGRITYYMGAQVALFAGLQSALFAMLLNDDDVPAGQLANTKSMMLNSTTDSFLRGFGIQGAVMSAFKNATQEYFKQSAKGYRADYSEVGEDLLNISPPIGSKFGMLDRAGDQLKFDKTGEGFKFKLGNPSLEASLMTVQAVTNAPVYSPYQNAFNLKHAMSDQYETWQRVLMGSGWTPYSVGVETEEKKKKKKPRTRGKIVTGLSR